jgi:glycosyltransferase involved in cell wall biosynthesis
MSPPFASVIIVNHNGLRFLAPCLESVLAQEASAPYEVIVVDNGSTDGSQALVSERFGAVRLIENGENVGFAAANNIGMDAASAPVFVFLNNDTEVHPGWLEALVGATDAPGVAGAAGDGTPDVADGDGEAGRAVPTGAPEAAGTAAAGDMLRTVAIVASVWPSKPVARAPAAARSDGTARTWSRVSVTSRGSAPDRRRSSMAPT